MTNVPCFWQAEKAEIREQPFPSGSDMHACEAHKIVHGFLLLNHRLSLAEFTGNQFLAWRGSLVTSFFLGSVYSRSVYIYTHTYTHIYFIYIYVLYFLGGVT